MRHASLRLGCNLNYDRLQDLAENHRKLRHMLGIGDWDDATSLDWRRIRDNVCLLKPETIARVYQLAAGEGERLDQPAAKTARVDSFVMETNIHYPTDSSLLCARAAEDPAVVRAGGGRSGSVWQMLEANKPRRRIAHRLRILEVVQAIGPPMGKAYFELGPLLRHRSPLLRQKARELMVGSLDFDALQASDGDPPVERPG